MVIILAVYLVLVWLLLFKPGWRALHPCVALP